jgi:hypothetical protein
LFTQIDFQLFIFRRVSVAKLVNTATSLVDIRQRHGSKKRRLHHIAQSPAITFKSTPFRNSFIPNLHIQFVLFRSLKIVENANIDHITCNPIYGVQSERAVSAFRCLGIADWFRDLASDSFSYAYILV